MDKPDPSDAKDDGERPLIDLSQRRMFCSIHGEPFREQWPRGALIFQCKALEVIFKDSSFWDEIEARFGPAKPVPASSIEAVLDSRPVCCRLGGDRLLETYEWQYANKGIGTQGFCQAPRCGRFAPGAPMLFKPPGRDAQRTPHVCFQCVAMYIVPAAS